MTRLALTVNRSWTGIGRCVHRTSHPTVRSIVAPKSTSAQSSSKRAVHSTTSCVRSACRLRRSRRLSGADRRVPDYVLALWRLVDGSAQLRIDDEVGEYLCAVAQCGQHVAGRAEGQAGPTHVVGVSPVELRHRLVEIFAQLDELDAH